MTFRMTPKDKPHESKGKPFCMRLAYPSVWDGQRGNCRSGLHRLKQEGEPKLPNNRNIKVKTFQSKVGERHEEEAFIENKDKKTDRTASVKPLDWKKEP